MTNRKRLLSVAVSLADRTAFPSTRTVMMPVAFRTGTLESVPVTTIRSTVLTPRSEIRPDRVAPCLHTQRHRRGHSALVGAIAGVGGTQEVVADARSAGRVMTD